MDEDGLTWPSGGPYWRTYPVEYIPGFLPTIDELHNVQGYGLRDIGADFGLGHERVRKYFEKYGFERHEEYGTMYRIWSDEENRFVPISAEDYEVILESSKARKKEITKGEKIADIVWTQINALQKFQQERGRPPKIGELAKMLGYSVGKDFNGTVHLAYYWGYSPENDVSYQEALDNLYRVAGLEKRFWRGGRGGVLRSIN